MRYEYPTKANDRALRAHIESDVVPAQDAYDTTALLLEKLKYALTQASDVNEIVKLARAHKDAVGALVSLRQEARDTVGTMDNDALVELLRNVGLIK